MLQRGRRLEPEALKFRVSTEAYVRLDFVGSEPALPHVGFKYSLVGSNGAYRT